MSPRKSTVGGALSRQSDNVLKQQSRNVLLTGYNFLLLEGGDYGRRGHCLHERTGVKEVEGDAGGYRQAQDAEGGGLDDRTFREAGKEACQGGKGGRRRGHCP